MDLFLSSLSCVWDEFALVQRKWSVWASIPLNIEAVEDDAGVVELIQIESWDLCVASASYPNSEEVGCITDYSDVVIGSYPSFEFVG